MIDFHCHLDLFPDPAEASKRCDLLGVYVLSVTTTPSAWPGTLQIAEGHKRIRTALGLHPQVAHLRMKELSLFEQYLPDTRYVGEIGLDGKSDNGAFWREQVKVFTQTLRLCERAGGRYLSVHSRGAVDEVVECLQTYGKSSFPILHWFTGDERQARSAINAGCWFSVNAAMTSSEKGRRLIACLPRDRVLTETDAPFAKSSGRKLVPWEMSRTRDELAQIWNISREECSRTLLMNLRNLATHEFSRS